MPKLNAAVEPLVREAFAAAVGSNIDRSAAAVKSMVDGGGSVLQDSINLAAGIIFYALFDIHNDERPDDQQLRELADSFVEMEAWAAFEADSVFDFLGAVVDGRKLDGVLAPEFIVRIVFVMGAWLLAAFGSDERRWYQYLDQILVALETSQE